MNLNRTLQRLRSESDPYRAFFEVANSYIPQRILSFSAADDEGPPATDCVVVFPDGDSIMFRLDGKDASLEIPATPRNFRLLPRFLSELAIALAEWIETPTPAERPDQLDKEPDREKPEQPGKGKRLRSDEVEQLLLGQSKVGQFESYEASAQRINRRGAKTTTRVTVAAVIRDNAQLRLWANVTPDPNQLADRKTLGKLAKAAKQYPGTVRQVYDDWLEKLSPEERKSLAEDIA